jgi:glycosyltransferase involved in cell wall biosynthesis
VNLRVVHVLEAVQFGTVRYLRGIVHHVDADHVVVLAPEGSGRYFDQSALDAMRADGARIVFVPMRRSPVAPQNALAVARVHRLIRREGPAVVHGHSSIGGAVARAAVAGTGVPAVYTPNGLFPSRSALALERALGRVTQAVIATSPSEAEVVVAERLVPPARVATIPNGVDLELPAPIGLREQLGLAADTPLVGNVGRLASQKAPEVFVRACALAAAAHPDAHFVLIGDGELADLVDREVAAGGFGGRFHVVRMPSGGDAAMAELDVFALSSRYEGAAYAPMEAMRAGVPVVLTDVVGNRDAIEAGVSGLLVPPDDPAGLAAGIGRLLGDPRLRAEIGANGRRRVEEHFDLKVLAGRLEHLYRSAARLPDPP